ncbi:hypothetical protein, partial [Megasphaera sp.]|uniref:hypothetical protein n=1 Tax=Megasphaera sp. TaxID=2023260 RepID=UPI003F041310
MKLRTTNYQETGLAHDDIGLHAPVPFLKQPLRPPSAASSPMRRAFRQTSYIKFLLPGSLDGGDEFLGRSR